MIFGRLQWVSHNGFPIYSIDVHPDGKRFASGGGDHKVKIWNFEMAIKDGTEGVKLYAAMEGHGGPVNCVRFSPDGRFLATASDDHMVLLWELRSGPATPVFGADETNIENWSRSATLSGHTTAVNDISWSPDGKRLVTCSLSSEVFVWDVFAGGGRGGLAAKLVGHTGFVKGVAWDPLNRFIATEADDKTVIIWRVSDWEKEAVFSKPYRNSSSNCFFRRIGWSPDGSFLATVYGFNNTSHVAPILFRGSWGSNYCDFVGHKKPVVCAKFNPVLFIDSDAKKNKRTTLSYCAVGSQDCGLSVWSTETTRPKLVTKNLFTQSVLDIAWAPNGYALLCCSTDGTVASLQFDTKELGEPMSARERNEMLKKLGAPSVDAVSALVEHPTQLQLEMQAQQSISSVPTQSSSTAPTSDDTSRPSPSTSAASSSLSSRTTASPASSVLQTESRLPTGKRRITPQFLGSTYASPRPVTPFTEPSTSASTPVAVSAVASSTSTIVAAATDAVPSSSSSVSLRALTPPTKTQPSSADRAREPLVKKPRLETNVGDDGGNVASKVPSKSPGDKGKQKEKDGNTKKKLAKRRDQGKDKAKTPSQAGSRTSLTPQGRPSLSDSARTSLDRLPRNKSLSGGSSLHSASGPLIPVPIFVPKIALHLHPPTYESASLAFLEVAVTTPQENVYTSIIACKESGRTIWEDYLSGRATAVAGNSNFSAVGCEDGSLYIYSPAGRRLYPTITLGSPITHLDSNLTRHLLAVTSDARFYIWDVQGQKVTATGSLSSILSGGAMLERVRVLLEGSTCLAMMTNHHAHIYHSAMQVWMRVADNSFSRSAFHSQFRLHNIEVQTADKNESLAQLQTVASDGERADLRGMLEVTLAHQKAETVAHLEHQIAASLLLQSRHEYRYWLETYVRYLTTEALLARLEELCASLLGPPSRSSTELPTTVSSFGGAGPVWEPVVLGLNKRQLLRELLPIAAQNRACQRLCAQYQEYLRIIQQRESTPSSASALTTTSSPSRQQTTMDVDPSSPAT